LLADHLRAFQSRWDQDGRLRLHEENRYVSIRLGDAATDYVPFIQLSTSVDNLAEICRLLAENYGRWLKGLQPAELADARRNPLDLPGLTATDHADSRRRITRHGASEVRWGSLAD